MIYITGDCHNNFERFNTRNFPEQKEMTKDDYVIICGDFGGVWNKDGESKMETSALDWLDGKAFTTLFVDGNHENFDRLYAYPVEMWHGGKAHKIRPSVIHLMRGQIFELEEKKIFTFGGASSHDISAGILEPDDPKFKLKKKVLDRGWEPYRINHISWWKEELPSEEEKQEGLKNLQKYHNEVDFIVTHCCASSTQASRPARQNFRQVKHLDANVIMDHYVLKKPKVRTRVHEKTFHIYENQKVYNFVKLLEKRLWALEQELEDKKMQMNRAAQGENRSKYDDVEENSGVAGTKKSIDELCSTITNLKGKLQAVYQIPMFKNEKYKEQKVYPLRTSNLFVNHKRYKKLFHQMRTYREMGELVEETVQYSSYHKSSEIYEIWCYFKILEIFILEKGYVIDRISWPGKKEKPFVFEAWENQDYSKVVHAIKKYIENREKRDSVKILEELVIHITNGKNDIYLGYNCTFQGEKASKAEVDEKGAVQYSTEQLRPDIFLILNKEIFFACDAKYKNYSKEFMGIQAWYTDLFECGAYKYIYRLNLGNVTDENSGKCMLPVKKKFVGEDSLKPVLKNGGVCILTPAISDSDMPSYYNGFEIEKKYETFLELLQEGKVNRDYRGCEILDSREYSCKLKEAICGEDGRESKYEYRIASTKFLPGNDRGFYNLFYEAFEYGQAHFLKAVF